MKKLLLTIAAIATFAGASYAQTAAPAAQQTKTATTTTKHVTKSGMPDKRYKENKMTTTTATAGPVKKDGTPDMRYKANKTKTTTVQKTTTK